MAKEVKAFVTGATGFMGRHLVRLLLAKEVQVTCLVRNPAKAQDLEQAGACLVTGDITDRTSLAAALPGHRHVYHLAAWVQLGLRPRDEPAMRQVNVEGTRNVLEEAWKAGVERSIHCGTVGALGPSGPPGYVGDENHVHSGQFPSLYVKTKYESVQVARHLIRQGAPIIIVLPQATYGPETVELTGRQIWSIKTGRLTAIPDAPMIFGYVHVDDVAEGMWLAAKKGRIGESYILGSHLLTLAEFCETVARHLGVPPPRGRISPRLLRILSWIYENVPGGRWLLGNKPLSREEIAMSTEANFAYRSDKAARELGWKARSLDEGLPETIQWIKDNEAPFERT